MQLSAGTDFTGAVQQQAVLLALLQAQVAQLQAFCGPLRTSAVFRHSIYL